MASKHGRWYCSEAGRFWGATMGTDMFGVIEIRDCDRWRWAADLEDVLRNARDYDLFGCLFGVRNYARFRPAFPRRGLPDDLDERSRSRLGEFEGEETDASWFTLDEFMHVSPNEHALAPDERVRTFEIIGGEERFLTKSRVSDDIAELLRNQPEVRLGDRVYRRAVMRRSEALGSFQPAIDLMHELAEREGRSLRGIERGRKGVRIVAWFID